MKTHLKFLGIVGLAFGLLLLVQLITGCDGGLLGPTPDCGVSVDDGKSVCYRLDTGAVISCYACNIVH